MLGGYFFGKITIVLYWFLQMFFLGGPRLAYRYFRYTRARHHAMATEQAATLVLGRAADAEVLLRAIESNAVKKIWPVGILSPSPADQGQWMRGVPVLGGLDHPLRARAEPQARNDLDEGTTARSDDEPAAIPR
jgi:O-antigen biosynthesis protein WbqV